MINVPRRMQGYFLEGYNVLPGIMMEQPSSSYIFHITQGIPEPENSIYILTKCNFASQPLVNNYIHLNLVSVPNMPFLWQNINDNSPHFFSPSSQAQNQNQEHDSLLLHQIPSSPTNTNIHQCKTDLKTKCCLESPANMSFSIKSQIKMDHKAIGTVNSAQSCLNKQMDDKITSNLRGQNYYRKVIYHVNSDASLSAAERFSKRRNKKNLTKIKKLNKKRETNNFAKYSRSQLKGTKLSNKRPKINCKFLENPLNFYDFEALEEGL